MAASNSPAYPPGWLFGLRLPGLGIGPQKGYHRRVRVLVLVLVLAASVALAGRAEWLAISRNSNGDYIVLERVQAECPKHQLEGFYSGGNGRALHFCWHAKNGSIYARYEDGTERVYDSGNFYFVVDPDKS